MDRVSCQVLSHESAHPQQSFTRPGSLPGEGYVFWTESPSCCRDRLRARTGPGDLCCLHLPGCLGSNDRVHRSAWPGAGTCPGLRGSAPRSWSAGSAPREDRVPAAAAAAAAAGREREAGRARSGRTAAGGSGGRGRVREVGCMAS